jgi:glycosyltransferase involved in cell wall biosynthesis
MLEHSLAGSETVWRQWRRYRPILLAVFSYRYDVELIPELLENITPVVDGWVAFDDRKGGDLFSNEPKRRRILINRARELGATWVLAIDPDERIERGAATRIRALICERQRIIWELNLREMFTPSTYRVDGVWGAKMQGRLFPVFDGALNSDQPLHGAWCVPAAGYSVLPAGLNLYHLKMLTPAQRLARRDLYKFLDPNRIFQSAGYEYLADESNAVFEKIPPARDFFPAHGESRNARLHSGDVEYAKSSVSRTGAGDAADREDCVTNESQLGQLLISVGSRACRDNKIAVVVIALRAAKSMTDAVSSLIRQDTSAEIIVVNSGGGNAREVLKEYLQSIILVELAEPVYVGAARNIGIQVASAPFVAFLASDCVAEPGWIAKRVQAHLEGECAVASVVVNDKPRNPFAWAAHLMTYGHRMTGKTGNDTAAYGASYDRTLFDKYGYFSEMLRIGEDSEFHSRFRPSDPIRLLASIRTAHKNPGGPFTFIKDQVQRGLRARHTADFLRAEFTLEYIARAATARMIRSFRLSITNLRGRERLAAIASWPLLPLGAAFYLGGMIGSYIRTVAAERLFQQGTKYALLGQPEAAITTIERAVDLRPGTARYHLALSSLWHLIGKPDYSAREHYRGWDLDRRGAELRCSGPSTISMDSKLCVSARIEVKIVAFADAPAERVAEFLNAIKLQRRSIDFDVIVVETHDNVDSPRAMYDVRQTYKNFARFVSPQQLRDYLSLDGEECPGERPSFVVALSCSCLPDSEWLGTLAAYIATYPEIDLFQGSCRPSRTEGTGFIERMCHDLGFYPRGIGHEGLLCFAHASNWACKRALLGRSGGFVDDKGEPLSFWTITEQILRVGGSSVNAGDWQTQFRADVTLVGLLRRFYQDGYYAAKHVIATSDRNIPMKLFGPCSLRGTLASAWKFAMANFRVWRFRPQSAMLYGPVFILLLSVGIARQAGWVAGIKRSERGLWESISDQN